MSELNIRILGLMIIIVVFGAMISTNKIQDNPTIKKLNQNLLNNGPYITNSIKEKDGN